VSADVGVGLFQAFDEPQRRLLGILAQIMIDDRVDIPIGQQAPMYGLGSAGQL
jgi:hypothetical protein